MAQTNLFTAEHLTFTYPGSKQPTLTDLSVDIPRGKITTILGANGCGKSTFLRLLTRALLPDTGSISYAGRILSKIHAKEYAKQVAIVHQNNTAPADLTVERLVRFGRTPYTMCGFPLNPKEDQEKVEWALEETELLDLRHRALSDLSGGQRQRAFFALALAQDTKTLLLDEPTTFLDIQHQLQLLRLVRSLNEKYGMSIVMVLHDINQSLCYSDEIIALQNGNVLDQGAPGSVIDQTLVHELYGVDLPIVSVEGKPFLLPV